MRFTGCLALLLIAFSPGLFALPCAPAMLSVYDVPGFSCEIGPYTVKDFSYSLITASVTIADTDIKVTPTAGSDFSLQFSSPKFSVTAGNFAVYQLTYFWDPGDIRGLVDELDDPVSAPAFINITTDYCANGEFGILCPPKTGSNTVFDNGITHEFASYVPLSGVTSLGVQTTITLDASGGGSASFNSFSIDIAPEPATWLGGGAAMALLIFASRRRLVRRGS